MNEKTDKKNENKEVAVDKFLPASTAYEAIQHSMYVTLYDVLCFVLVPLIKKCWWSYKLICWRKYYMVLDFVKLLELCDTEQRQLVSSFWYSNPFTWDHGMSIAVML